MTSLMPKNSNPEEIESMQQIVTRLVISVLVDNPSLHYYQVRVNIPMHIGLRCLNLRWLIFI